MRPVSSEHEDPPLRLKIAGMDCGSCAATIEAALRRLPGVQRVAVDFTTETLELEGEIDRERIERRLQQLGYRAADRPPAPPLPGASGGPDVHPRVLAWLWGQSRQRLALLAALLALLGWAVHLARPGLLPERPLALLLAAIVLAIGAPIFAQGLRALLFSRRISIELLMTLAAIGALLIGEAGEAATVVLLFTLGEGLEGYSVARSRDSLRSLLALQPQTATLLETSGAGAGGDCCHDRRDCHAAPAGVAEPAHERLVPAARLAPGDLILVQPGERIPADGAVARGRSAIDPAAVTGESRPMDVEPGAEVLAGTVNLAAALEITVTRCAADSTLARIARLVEAAQAARSPAERHVDRFARWYTPAVVLLALAVVLVPVLGFGQPLLSAGDSVGWLYRGLALLVVACPCALVISIPVTMVSALTRLAQLGVLVKGSEHLDRLADARVFAFDKTGTLTSGRPAVSRVRGAGCEHEPATAVPCGGCDEVLALAAAVESGSTHPLAHAVLESAGRRGLRHRHPRAEAVTAVAGRGVIGELRGVRVAVGSPRLMREQGIAAESCARLERDLEHTLMLVAHGGELIGAIGLEDRPREASAGALEALRAARPGARLAVLTGDNERVAGALARHLPALDEVHAALLPEDKLERIESLQRRYGTVAMVGDGINDAPALARADVGVALGGAGTAQAMETADIVLMQDDLSHLPAALRIAGRARRLVRQNIALSLGLKLAFVALAIPGLATLWLAVAADVGATLLVTLNGMRLLRAR